MTTDQIIETLNSKIADLDALLATGIAGQERNSVYGRVARLYNARNRLPLHS